MLPTHLSLLCCNSPSLRSMSLPSPLYRLGRLLGSSWLLLDVAVLRLNGGSLLSLCWFSSWLGIFPIKSALLSCVGLLPSKPSSSLACPFNSSFRCISEMIPAIVIPILPVLGGLPELGLQFCRSPASPTAHQLPWDWFGFFFQRCPNRGLLLNLLNPASPRFRKVRRPGCHQSVEFGVPGKAILKGDNGAAALEQAVSELHIGDVGELVI